MRADGADADVQLGGDLRVGAALGDQGDQLAFPGAELGRSRCRGRWSGGGEHQGILRRRVPAHRRTAVLRRPRQVRSERLPGLAPLFLPARHEPDRLGASRHQPVPGQQARDLAHRTGPADETGQRGREAMHATRRGNRRRLTHSRHHNRGPPPRTARSPRAVPDRDLTPAIRSRQLAYRPASPTRSRQQPAGGQMLAAPAPRGH